MRVRSAGWCGRPGGCNLGAMPRLSVNLNKIALLRNSRRTGVPDVVRFGRIAHDAGADGLTVHPRPDERHIRRDDVFAIAELMRPWRPGFELNIEGYPDRRLLDLVRGIRPEQCTLVPDAADVLDLGGRLEARCRANARWSCRRSPALKPIGCRVILFVDPDPAVVERGARRRRRRHRDLYRRLCRGVSRRQPRRRCCAPVPRPRRGPRSSACRSISATISTSTICRRWSRLAGGRRGLDRARADRRRAGNRLCRGGARLQGGAGRRGMQAPALRGRTMRRVPRRVMI